MQDGNEITSQLKMVTNMDIEFEKMLAENEKKARENLHKDTGHIALIEDVGHLSNEVTNCEFHDFLNTKYATPKVELVNKLEAMKQKAMNGDCDN